MFNFVKMILGTASYFNNLSGYERVDSAICDMNGHLFYFTIFTNTMQTIYGCGEEHFQMWMIPDFFQEVHNTVLPESVPETEFFIMIL